MAYPRGRRTTAIALAAATIVSTGCASGGRHRFAGIEDVGPGDRVRMHSTAGAFVSGRVSARDSTSLTIEVAQDAQPIVLDFNSIASLECYTGSYRHVIAGAGIGATLGTVAGLTVVALRTNPDAGFGVLDPLPVPAGLMVGLAVGALAGATSKTEHWERVTSDRFGVAVEPEKKRASVFWDF